MPNINFFKNHKSCSATSVDYIPPSEGLASLGLPLAVMASSPRFELDDGDGKWIEKCSSTIISDTGALLTNGHCVENCVLKAGLYRTTDEGSVVNRDQLNNLVCNAKINDVPVKFKILAMNDCRDNFDGLRLKGKYPNQVCNGLDYAILQPIAPFPQLPCMKSNADKLFAGTKLASLGFPEETYRFLHAKGARDSDGTSQQMSFGETITYQPYCTMKNDDLGFFDSGKRAFDQKQIDFTKKFVSSGNVMQSTVDGVLGSSGGALFNQNAEFVGIQAFGVSGSNKNDRMKQCDGDSFFIPLSAIKLDLKNRFPNVSFDQVFRCQNQAAVK